jgi:hypothetical protein
MTIERNPYAAPTAEVHAGRIEPSARFKPLGGLGAMAIFAVGLVLFLRLCCLALEYQLFAKTDAIASGSTVPRPEDLADSIAPLANVWQGAYVGALILFLVSGILVLCWIHRAHSNLPGLGNGAVQYTPGWCVGYWFIPILNLYRPYQAMCELMNGSDPKRYPRPTVDLPLQSGNLLLGFWWLFWILLWITGRVQRFLRDSEDMALVLSVEAVLTALLTASGLLTIVILRQVQIFQERRRELLLAGEHTMEAPFSQPTSPEDESKPQDAV